jgi:hypothetical protein
MTIYRQSEEDWWNCLSDDNEAFVWDTNSFMAIVAFVLSMGFKEIYLVGCDLTNKESDYFDDRKLGDEERASNSRLHVQLVTWLRRIQPKLNTKGITLFSATKGSRINKFLPYASIEDINQEIKEELLFEEGPLYNSLSLENMRKSGVKEADLK